MVRKRRVKRRTKRVIKKKRIVRAYRVKHHSSTIYFKTFSGAKFYRKRYATPKLKIQRMKRIPRKEYHINM